MRWIAGLRGPAGRAVEGRPGAGRSLSARFLLAGALAVAAMAVAGGPLRGWILSGITAATCAATAAAARRQPERWGPATFLFLAMALLVPAYVLWYPLTVQLDLALGSPSIIDVLFIGGYLAFLLALARFIRSRDSEERRLQVLDTLIISIGLGVLAWVLLISPFIREEALSGPATAVAVTYPVLDLLLVGAVVRLLVQGGMESVGNRLLAGWVAVQLVADLTWTVTSLRGTFDLGNAAPMIYAASFVLLGAAALHPTVLRVEERPARPASGLRRLWLVGAAAMIAPCVLVVLGLRGETRDVPIVALLSAALFLLALGRIGLLMVDIQEHRRIQARLEASVLEERRQVAANTELLVSLRERQMLADRLARIQRKISTRAPLDDVLDAITAGAAELLGDEVVALRLVDEDDPGLMRMASSVGIPEHLAPDLRTLPVGQGVGGQAVAHDRLCIQEGYATWPGALEVFAEAGLTAAMAAPVHLEGHPMGSLVVASFRPGRRYSTPEQDVLSAFAEHVSLALNDARTVEAMHEALDQALHQAMHDSLTGLPNRACFYDRAGQALRLAAREGTATGVLLFDLDRFKEINDTLGHRYGDRVLCEIGPRITSVLRASDTLARLGGDEFCVLLPDVSGSSEAQEVARRIIAALEEPIEVDGMLLAVEASCGIVVAPGHGDTADLLLQRADVAMYVAKTTHADAVVYEPALDENTPDRLALLGELRSAIAGGQLLLHFQPQAALADRRVEGVEALVRWEHSRLGLLAPDQFVPIAEDTGLIKPLTAWVLDAALAQLGVWLADPALDLAEGFSVAVNVSTRCLLDDGFGDDVRAALERNGIPAANLVLEVTETTIMADPERAHRVLTELAAAGVRFAIDDFGTGYSSLAALKALPVHQLKIDRSFVRDMHEVANDATIVRSVIDLGRTLGLRTIAEGVEVAAAWERLAELGCDAAQGYLLARPMHPAALRAWLADARAPALTASAR